MHIELIAVAISLFVSFVLACIILIRNPRSFTSKSFFVLTLSLILFSTINYISVNADVSSQLSLIRLDAAAGAAVFLATFITFKHFPSRNLKKLSPEEVLLGGLTVILWLLLATPLIFADLTIVDGQPTPSPGKLIFLVPLHHLYLITRTAFILRRKLKDATRLYRKQLGFIISGLATVLLSIAIFNFIFVQGLKDTRFVNVSSFAILAFTAMFFYSIVKHKFLDIKTAVARSLVYIFSLGFIGIVYGGFVYVASSLFSKNLQSDDLQRATFIIFALVSATLFHPIRLYFDGVTKKIFFRDAYDPQTLIDQLNQALVANIELNILLRHTSQVIEDNYKSEFCFVVVREEENSPARIVGRLDAEFNAHNLDVLFKNLQHTRSKVIVTDDVGPSHIKKVLTENNVAVACRLPSGYGQYEHTEAYLLLGPKKSGNLYSESDIKLLEIIADELMIAIQNAFRFEEIQGFAATLQQEVNQATAKLKKTNEKLKALDETKDEFISMASHQLRTPLTSVKGYMSMVLEGDAGKLNKQQEQLLNQAFVSSQRMVYLIADLLNVSRLKTGKFIVEAHPTNLANVVEGEISQLTEVAKGKKLKLTYKKPKKFPELMLDETKIRQVIMNFADNSIYYTPAGGKIDIQLKEDKSNIYFMVKDNGLGVPKDEQKHLFGKFYRAKNARKARPDGTGLGLFMAKKVVSAQGGDILFESKEGKGSTFGFAFSKHKLAVKK